MAFNLFEAVGGYSHCH